MKHALILFLLFSLPLTSFSQNDGTTIDGWIEVFRETLSLEAQENMFTTSRSCMGNVQMFTLRDGSRCIVNEGYIEAYVFYKEGDSVFVKKFDNCSGYNSLVLADTSFFDFYINNRDALLADQIEPYKAANPNTQPQARTQVYRCSRGFTYYTPDSSNSVGYKLYDLSTDQAQPNVNFEANNATKTTQLDKMLDAVIATAQQDPKYKRD